MTVRRVYLIWTHPLLLESLRLLLKHPEVELVGAATDYAAARGEILDRQPDTILVEEIEGTLPDQVMEILDFVSWNVRVVGLNLEDNRLRVFHRRQSTVTRADDLLQIVLQ